MHAWYGNPTSSNVIIAISNRKGQGMGFASYLNYILFQTYTTGCFTMSSYPICTARSKLYHLHNYDEMNMTVLRLYVHSSSLLSLPPTFKIKLLLKFIEEWVHIWVGISRNGTGPFLLNIGSLQKISSHNDDDLLNR